MRRSRRARHHDAALRPWADWHGMISKGKQYSTIVRRAGLAWGKGDLQKAIAALQEGIMLAAANGDVEVVRVFQQDIERYQRATAGEELDLSRS